MAKNKAAPPFKLAEFDIEYGAGISKEGGLLDMALEHDLIQKSGSFFSYGDERLGQGRNNVKAHLRENPSTAKEIEKKIYDAIGMTPETGPPAEVAEIDPKAPVEAVEEAPVEEPAEQAA